MAELLFVLFLWREMRQERSGLARTDSSAAKGMAGRTGSGYPTSQEEASKVQYKILPEARRTLAALEGKLAVEHKDGGWIKEAVDTEEVASVVAAWRPRSSDAHWVSWIGAWPRCVDSSWIMTMAGTMA